MSKRVVNVLCGAGLALFLQPESVLAACVIPNPLTNGALADAADVMGNFNAVAACADAAVTPVGSPGAGEIVVFSGVKSVTGGNLSGDVTTSGGTVTTLSASGVTPGTYLSANITVDAKGRITLAADGSGGGGGYEAGFPSPPLASSFAWDNQGASSATDTAKSLAIDIQNGNAYRGIYAAKPGSRVYYRMDLMSPSNISGSIEFIDCGIGIRNSSNGRWVAIFLQQQGVDNYYVRRLTTSSPSTVVLQNSIGSYRYRWFSVEEDGANIKFYISTDGWRWVQVYTEPLASYLTAAGGSADQSGIMVRANGDVGQCLVYYYSFTAP